MKIIPTFVIGLLFGFCSASAGVVNRNGFTIEVPDGNWKRWTGTCTGESGWSREGISFSIGLIRYRAKDAKFTTSGDIYRISNFSELHDAILERAGPSAKLLREEFRKVDKGIPVAIFELALGEVAGSPSECNVLSAYRETPDQSSVVVIACNFTSQNIALAKQVFDSALASLCAEIPPNKSVDPTTTAVTAPAGQEPRHQ